MKKSRVLCMLIIAMLTFSMTAEVTVLPVAAKTSTSTKKNKKKSKKKSKKSTKKKSKKSSKKNSSGSTTTPAASAPAASAPVAAAPSAPVVSAPAASAPVASAPQTEAPAAKAPAASAPAAQQKAPAAKAPAASAPAATTPQTEAPAAQQKATTPSAPAKKAAPATSQTEAPAAQQKATTPSAPAKKAAPVTSQTEAPAAQQKATTPSAPAKKAAPATPQTEAPATQQKAPAATTPQTEAPAAQQKATTPSASATPQTEAPAPKKAAETEHVCEFTDWVVTKEPYCGYMGYDMTWRDTGEEVGTCAVCGKKKTRGVRVENHNFELVSKETTATCEKGGTKTYKCKDCGYKKTETVTEALGHDMKHYDDPATCTEDGHSYDKCSRCGLVTNDVKTTDKTGHNFNVGDTTPYVVRKASCTLAGVIEIPCQNGCGAKTTKYIPATGHQMSEETVAATCTANQKIVSTCSVCGAQETKEIPNTKLQHQMLFVNEKPSTTREAGYKITKCQNCSYSKTETIERVTHTHDWQPVSELNETEGALASMSGGKIRTERCKAEGCNELRYTYNPSGDRQTWVPWEEVPCAKQGHTWAEEKSDKGYTLCTVCGMTKPGDGKNDSRIVWSVTIQTELNGICAVQPTTISSENHIDYTAPEITGYEFSNWTWSRLSENNDIPDNLFLNGDKRTLHIPCEYMDVIFTAHYKAIGEAAAALASISVDPEALPSVIHGEMSIDLDMGTEPAENAPAESAGEEPAAQEAEGQEEVIVHEEEE